MIGGEPLEKGRLLFMRAVPTGDVTGEKSRTDGKGQELPAWHGDFFVLLLAGYRSGRYIYG